MITNVLEYLEASERRSPQKTAYTDKMGSVSFGEFAGRARQLGSFLARRQITGVPVAVFMEKSVAMLEGFMGAVYSGCFYCPIDVEMPRERIAAILKALKPAALLTCEALREPAGELLAGLAAAAQPEPAGAGDSPAAARTGEWTGGPDKTAAAGQPAPRLITLEEALAETADEVLLAGIRRRALDTDPLYVLFTSGSTGVPKGVLISHRVMINNMEWLEEEYDFGPEDVLGNQVPFYFDVSDHDIYSVMKFGCSMVIIPPELFAFPVRLVQFLNEHRVTAIFWVPFALCMAANLNAFASEVPAHLRYIFFAGEVMPVKQLNYWRRYLPQALYVNMYGPTETYVCTYYNVNREFREDESLPIGAGCKNMEILVLDEENRLIRPGDPGEGELCVRGCALSLGYYGEPEKTAERFVQNPLQTAWPEKIYRTGDIVSYNEFGELIYIGRSDFQIKHLGYRIELGEIETAAGAVDGISACACVYDRGRKMILLIYSGEKRERRELLSLLGQRIPKYMLPNRMIHMDELPRNANGKIDRRKLEELWT